jgi:hypothetical protein
MRIPRRVALLALTFAACPAEWHPSWLLRGGVSVERVDLRAVPGQAAGVVAGDFVLVSGPLRVAIAGLGRPANGGTRPGAIVHAALLERPDPDDVQALEPIVTSEGRELVLSDPSFDSTVVDGRATLELVATTYAPSGATLRVHREYSLDVRSSALVIATRVDHVAGPPARAVAVGARLAWGAPAPVSYKQNNLTTKYTLFISVVAG